MQVSVRAEQVFIPTYQVGKPDKNPIFGKKSLSGLQWQGLSSYGDRYRVRCPDHQGAKFHAQPYKS